MVPPRGGSSGGATRRVGRHRDNSAGTRSGQSGIRQAADREAARRQKATETTFLRTNVIVSDNGMPLAEIEMVAPGSRHVPADPTGAISAWWVVAIAAAVPTAVVSAIRAVPERSTRPHEAHAHGEAASPAVVRRVADMQTVRVGVRVVHAAPIRRVIPARP
jgi:hypothetical protein